MCEYSHSNFKKKYSTMIRLSRAVACVVFSLLTAFQATAATDEYQEAHRLMTQGELGSALEHVDRFLAKQPRDARARFLKGVILTEQGNSPEAIKVFTDLTVDYPELPEPYNNLAVLYAAQGQDEKARQALETAIRTHPTYATAHENLGDIYAKMAREAYGKALQLDSNNASARAKLALVKELFSQKPLAQQPLVKTTIADPPQASPAPKPAPAPAAPVTPLKAPEPGKQPPTPSKPPAPSADRKQAKETANPQAEVLHALHAWAKAWSAGDAARYLSFYSPSFDPPGDEDRSNWAESRRDRVTKGKGISVQIQSPHVTFSGPEEAVVTFRQIYRSTALRASGNKRITFVRRGGRWLIQQEEVVR
ncbi:MAG: tetratricopeptide repeat protein [Betaproteobacteria bacterium]|nr:tetratricopeptide repeat protein [Betaproteobacteria bacterium]